MVNFSKIRRKVRVRLGRLQKLAWGDKAHPRPVPWLAGLAINLLIFTIFASTARFKIGYEVLLADNAIPITILSESALRPEFQVEEDLATEETPDEPEPVQEVLPAEPPDLVPDKQRDPEPEQGFEERPEPQREIPPPPPPEPQQVTEDPAIDPYAGLTGPEIDELYRQRQLPQIALPDGQAGGASGVVAIFCYDEFDNRDKAAECAGRTELLSGWRRTNEDWSGIRESLRRGGVNTPGNGRYIGQASRDPLRENESYYDPYDQGLILGPKVARRLENERKFKDLQDERAGVMLVTDPLEQSLSNTGGGVTSYITDDKWEPSWTLREDPVLDRATIEEIQRQKDAQEEDRKN